jgi:hypothetical protein
VGSFRDWDLQIDSDAPTCPKVNHLDIEGFLGGVARNVKNKILADIYFALF